MFQTILDTTKHRGGEFVKYLVNLLGNGDNTGGFGTPMVSRSNSAGWRQFGRKFHAEETTVVFMKSAKNTAFWPKYGFFGTLAPFWMTSA